MILPQNPSKFKLLSISLFTVMQINNIIFLQFNSKSSLTVINVVNILYISRLDHPHFLTLLFLLINKMQIEPLTLNPLLRSQQLLS